MVAPKEGPALWAKEKAESIIKKHADSYGGPGTHVSTIRVIQNALLEAHKKGEMEGLGRVRKKIANIYGGKAHTYASENSEVYRAQDLTLKIAVERIDEEIQRIKEGK